MMHHYHYLSIYPIHIHKQMEYSKWIMLLFLSILLSIGEIVKLSSSFSPTFNYHTFRSRHHSSSSSSNQQCRRTCGGCHPSAFPTTTSSSSSNTISRSGTIVTTSSSSTNSGSTSRYVSQESTTISSEHAPNNSNLSFNNDNEKNRGSILIPGKHKWLGGAVDSEGRIYGIPSNAKDIICLVPSSLSSLSSSCSSKEENKKEEEMTHADNRTSRMDEGDDLNLDLDSIGNYTVHMIPLPSRIADGPFKWLRGIICGDYLYGIPAWSQQGVLRVDIASYWKDHQVAANSVVYTERRRQEDDTYVTTIPLPEGALESIHSSSSSSNSSSSSSPSRWLWHGAALNQNKTAIYAIPSNARHVLKINLQTQTTCLLSIPTTTTSLEQTNKWYGGILGDDNAIYGVPYAASGVLRIDANHDTVKVIGDELFGIKKYNWHGGVKSGKNGKIYCFPAHHSHVLCIDTRWNSVINHPQDDATPPPEEEDRLLELLPIHRADYDKDEVTKYKWLGGSIGADGNVYGMPSDASSILRIDTNCNVATTFGRVSQEKNKYQGGTLARDGVIYAIPSNANDILCIDTNQVHVAAKNDKLNNEIEYFAQDAAFTIGDIYALTETKRKDKWQGGFLGKDGSVYCIPENFNRILKLIPQKKDSDISFL